MLEGDRDELHRLRAENARLRALLSRHGIAWEQPCTTTSGPAALTTRDKIALFRRLFRGRDDVYARRWDSPDGKPGYSPAYGNARRPGTCHLPRVQGAGCNHRQLLPLSDQTIHDHLTGKQTIGVYPLLGDDRCRFLAADFDGGDWWADARAFMQSCALLDIPAALEISRSGEGAHVWIFFSEPVPAREARQLGTALISETCARTRQLSLNSYDRLFPSQDTVPKGGFGNLIALPLQKQPRASGHSVFVDADGDPYPDQWAFLASITRLSRRDLEEAILRVSDGRHPLDVSFAGTDEESTPWERPAPLTARLNGPLPDALVLTLANQIFIAKADLPQPLANRLIRLAAFQNPEFYKAQAMRLSVWNKPRLIGCAENHPQHIGLPRGCLDAVLDVLQANAIHPVVRDARLAGQTVTVRFKATLRKDQETALQDMLEHDTGVLCAPTAFGKTVTAAALIARRSVSTLVLVHRTELLRQWQERLTACLDLPEKGLGVLGGGRNTLSHTVDIALMQSLSRREDPGELLARYGQIIVDECHHLSAVSFERILKQARSRFVVGLTATPVRRDGHQPILFMQCGPIRHRASRPENAPTRLSVRPTAVSSAAIPLDAPIQTVFRALASETSRNRQIAGDVLAAYREGRKVLVLSERTDQLPLLQAELGDAVEHCFVLHGRLSKRQRATVLAELDALDDSVARVILATGRLIGEGFDHPPLDTLVLAMPISWKGTLQQYAGRLHRAHADKTDVRIHDYAETDHPQLARMWEKRQRGYRAMGYTIEPMETGSGNRHQRLPPVTVPGCRPSAMNGLDQ